MVFQTPYTRSFIFLTLPRPQRCPLNYFPLAPLMAFPKLPSGAGYPLLTGLSPRQDWFGLTHLPQPSACPLPRLPIRVAILG
jgi:hypothetical protein